MALYKTILLFGAPGAGKGTQGRILGRIPGFVHFECGEVFRRLNTNSKIGQIFLKYSRKGELVPDDVTVAIWSEHIEKQITAGVFKPESDLLVMDGIPRTVEQAKLLADKISLVKAFNLDCSSEAIMMDRIHARALKENRIDDTKEEVIHHRWEVYHSETAPVLDYYGPDLVVNVSADGSPIEVLEGIIKNLIPHQQPPPIREIHE